jgi:hypothetical protein
VFFTAVPAFLAGSAALVILLLVFVNVFFWRDPPRKRAFVEDPAGDFTRWTGLPWPENARISSVDDDHGGWRNDGAFHIVFDADRATLEKWLAGPPPWSLGAWQRGPVPLDLFSGFDRDGGNDQGYELMCEEVLKSDKTWYVAKDRGRSLKWAHYNLLILDPTNNRVWLSCVDF